MGGTKLLGDSVFTWRLRVQEIRLYKDNGKENGNYHVAFSVYKGATQGFYSCYIGQWKRKWKLLGGLFPGLGVRADSFFIAAHD